MKNLLLLALSFFYALPVFAVEDFNYNVQIVLKQNASAKINETITFYTDSEAELPILKRDIETNTALNDIFISGNVKYLQFTTNRVGNTTSIQTVMNPFSRKGKNTITLSYIVPNVVYSYMGKDCFKFNLQLSNWSYKFKQGAILFRVDGNHITKNSSLKIDKHILPLQEDEEFQLTPFLDKNIFFDFSFDKGFFDTYSIFFHSLRNSLNILPILVTFLMIIYSYILWIKYGKDPTGPFVTQYKPPRNITAVFAKYLLNKNMPFDYSYFMITLISLSLRGFIDISEYQDEICIKSLKGTNSSGLCEEDKLIYERLFAYSPKIVFSVRNATYVIDAIKALYVKMENKKKKFFGYNSWYAVAPCFFMLVSFLLIFPLEGTWQILALLCFTISLITFIFFVILIKNVSPELLGIYNEIMGFKQYMNIAESKRAKLSNPLDKERLFCDNLDYAYAFGISPKVLKKFSNKLNPYIMKSINCLHQDRTVLILSSLLEPLEL